MKGNDLFKYEPPPPAPAEIQDLHAVRCVKESVTQLECWKVEMLQNFPLSLETVPSGWIASCGSEQEPPKRKQRGEMLFILVTPKTPVPAIY